MIRLVLLLVATLATLAKRTGPPPALFAVASFNVQNLRDLPRSAVRKCGRIVRRHAGVIGFQEIAEREDDDDLEHELPRRHWIHRHRRSENKISVRRTRWRIARVRRLPLRAVPRVLLHKGRAKVTPHRELTHVVLEWTHRPRWTPFAFGNTHLISGIRSRKVFLPWRKAQRRTSYDRIRTWVESMHAAGLPVILVGDFNDVTPPKMHPDWRWITRGGIDHVGYLNAPGATWQIEVVNVEEHETPSDHPLIVANLRGVAR